MKNDKIRKFDSLIGSDEVYHGKAGLLDLYAITIYNNPHENKSSYSKLEKYEQPKEFEKDSD